MDGKKRTLGINLIAIFSIIFGVLFIWFGTLVMNSIKDLSNAVDFINIFSLFLSILEHSTWEFMEIEELQNFLTIVSLIFISLGVIFLVSLYGLWTLKSWGLKLTLFSHIIVIILNIIIWSGFERDYFVIWFFFIIISTISIIYLWQNRIKKLFIENELTPQPHV